MYISLGEKRGKATHLRFVGMEIEGHNLVSSIYDSRLLVQYSLNYNILKPAQQPTILPL